MTAVSEGQTAVGGAAAAARQSTLSSRITNVLSTSYSDNEIRQAIAILDGRNFENTVDARRQLRLDVQEEVIRRNADILDDFKGVADELRAVELSLSRLTATCAAMRAQIQAANKTTAPVIDEASTLFKHKKENETKEQILSAFQKHYLLSDAESTILTSPAEPVNDDFFNAMHKLKRIYADSQLLLSSANDRLGLSILDASTKTLNSAFQKLFRWTQREFKTLDLENPRLGAAIRKSLRILAERPQLFTESLDNFASAREETLSESFHAALTGRGDAVIGKPIEFQAHDPLRYISDMLAWTHSATISEREALEVLFINEGQELARGIKEGRANDPWSRRDDDGEELAEAFDGRKALNELVSRNTAGVARQLRQRTEQVIHSQEEAVTSYKIANLVSFYITTFQKLLGEDADVLKTLRAIEATAQRQFRNNMADQVNSAQPDSTVVPIDLSPPTFLTEALETLKLLLKSYDTSVAATIRGPSESDEPDTYLTDLLKYALDPFLDACSHLWSTLDAPGQAILALNCLLEVRSALASFPFTTARLATLDPQLRQQAKQLTEHQHAYLQSASGIGPLIQACAALQPHTSPSSSPDGHDDADAYSSVVSPDRVPDMLKDTTALGSLARRLDDFLPNALMDAMDNVAGLRSARLAREVTEEAAEQFCDEFSLVEDVILVIDAQSMATTNGHDKADEAEGEEERLRLRDVFPRTTEEIRVLLS